MVLVTLGVDLGPCFATLLANVDWTHSRKAFSFSIYQNVSSTCTLVYQSLYYRYQVQAYFFL